MLYVCFCNVVYIYIVFTTPQPSKFIASSFLYPEQKHQARLLSQVLVENNLTAYNLHVIECGHKRRSIWVMMGTVFSTFV